MKVLKYCLFLFLFVAIFSEVALRVLGVKQDYNWKIDMLKCYNHFVEFNTDLGYKNAEIDIQCTIQNPNDSNDVLPFQVKHLPDGSRYTGEYCLSDTQKSIHFYGCSVTWGHGVSDTSTFEYIAQSILKDTYCLKNFGVGSYSTLQSYLLFEDNISKGLMPSIAVLDYGSFQNSRNTMSFGWRNAWYRMVYLSSNDSIDIKFPEFKVPYASLEENKLKINYFTKEEMKVSSLRRNSALYDALYIAITRIIESRVDETIIAKRIIEKMKSRCDELGVVFILSGIYLDKETLEILEHYQKLGFKTVDISVDNSNPLYKLLPYDGHYNHVANEIMANKFVDYLKK